MPLARQRAAPAATSGPREVPRQKCPCVKMLMAMCVVLFLFHSASNLSVTRATQGEGFEVRGHAHAQAHEAVAAEGSATNASTSATTGNATATATPTGTAMETATTTPTGTAKLATARAAMPGDGDWRCEFDRDQPPPPPTVPPPPQSSPTSGAPSFDLSSMAVTILMSDQDVQTSLPSVLTAWLHRFPNRLILADTANPAENVEACCPTNLGLNIGQAQQKLEHAFAKAHERFPLARWYMFTETDTWWTWEALELMMAPLNARYERGAYPHGVSTGGGNKEYHKPMGPWIILDRTALRLLAHPQRMAWCRAGVMEHQRGGQSNCCLGRKKYNGSDVPYNNDHLVSYCLHPSKHAEPAYLASAACPSGESGGPESGAREPANLLQYGMRTFWFNAPMWGKRQEREMVAMAGGGKPSWEDYVLVHHLKALRGCKGYKVLFSAVSVHHVPPDKMTEIKSMYDAWRKCVEAEPSYGDIESRDPGAEPAAG